MRPTALITGASRGVGAAVARELASTHQLLLGATSADSLSGILDELPGAVGWPVDLTDFQKVVRMAEPISKLEVLVHCAAVTELSSVAESDLGQWRRTLELNLVAIAELTRLLLPALRAANGRVVLINSGAGQYVNPGRGIYAASKFGLRAWGDALRLEEPALRVTSIFPGRIDTDMQRRVAETDGDEYRPELYLTAHTVARAVRDAVETPADGHLTEMVLRPYPRQH
ncbi:SDR family oxidoreductase [Rhodococcus sp. NPDC003318]|uniref:SDR family oxidoreductase n=1 Tax=Rhodococcus sp. NPDC003318 TaxID=3364503 RepID=UPI00367A92D0